MNSIGDLDEITYDLEVDGALVRRTISTRTWTEGSWATVMIAYEERAKDGTTWKQPKVTLMRLRRSGEGWKKQSAVTLPVAHVFAFRDEIERLQPRLDVAFDPDHDEE